MNILRAIAILAFGVDDKGLERGTLIYFIAAVALNAASILCVRIFLKSSYYRKKNG
jgi:hypothetical protein